MHTPDDGAGKTGADPDALDPEAVLERDPRVLLDPHFLGALHAELVESLGTNGASAALLQMGFLHGLQDAVRALTLASGSHDPGPSVPPLNMHLRIAPAGAAVEVRGSWPDRHEASARLTAESCVGACELSAGYTSGWLSGMLDADLLAEESACGVEGHAACRFVAREAAVWRAAGGAAAVRADAIPFDAYRALVRAREARHAMADARPATQPSAGIDRDSACVHLWGPVMVIPFGGADEGLRALELLGSDPAAREVSVVIVDLDGAIVDEAFGALALEQIVQTADAWGAETIFAAVSALAEPVIADLEHAPLLVFKDLEEAVASAFQIARSQRRLRLTQPAPRAALPVGCRSVAGSLPPSASRPPNFKSHARTPESESMVAIPERGDLQETPLPRLLLDLHRAHFNGSLRLSRDRAEKHFLFNEGVPIYAESNLASETLGVQLMDAGTISRPDHARVCEHMRKKQCKEGTALIELRLLDPKALFIALKEQVRQRVVDCFGWPQGGFVVEPGAAAPQNASLFRADIFPLVQEGIETHWSADQVLSDLAPHMEISVRRTRRLSRIQERLRWDDAVQAFIDALDGTRTLWRALQCATTPRALAAAWVLDAARAIDYSTESASVDRERPAEIQIVVSDAKAARPGARASARASVPRAHGGIDEVLVQEIEEKFARLGELDHYELLGLDSSAAADAIRTAYRSAAKRFHPDALARAGVDADTRLCAGKVFGAIGRAHAVLSDPGRRREYDANLGSDESDLDAERLAAAETNFRKAEILLRTGNFRGALEYLRPAVDLWPEEAAYQAALGWALFKKLPSEPEPARIHLERAYELDPRDAQATFWLSTVLKALGETATAETLLARARQLDPKVG